MGKSVLENSNQLNISQLILVKDTNIHIISKHFKKCADYTYLIEKLIRIMDVFANIQSTKKMNLFVNIVIDFEDIVYSNVDFDFIKSLIHFFEEKYEDIINIIYCTNVNILFKVGYKIVKPFLSKDITCKLKFIKKGSSKILDKINDDDDEFDD